MNYIILGKNLNQTNTKTNFQILIVVPAMKSPLVDAKQYKSSSVTGCRLDRKISVFFWRTSFSKISEEKTFNKTLNCRYFSDLYLLKVEEKIFTDLEKEQKLCVKNQFNNLLQSKKFPRKLTKQFIQTLNLTSLYIQVQITIACVNNNLYEKFCLNKIDNNDLSACLNVS